MNIKEIRRINLARVIDQVGGSAKLAAMVDTAPAHLSQIMNIGHRATVGDKLARRIEEAAGLDADWMDADHSGVESSGERSPQAGKEVVLLDMFRRMTARQQESLLMFAADIDATNKEIIEELTRHR